MLDLTERFGLPATVAFMRVNDRDESLDAIRNRLQATFGASLEELEGDWIAVLPQEPGRSDQRFTSASPSRQATGTLTGV